LAAGVARIAANAGVTLIGSAGTSMSINAIDGTISLAGLQEYADDAAAALGGLTTNNLYKTTLAGSTFLKIVP